MRRETIKNINAKVIKNIKRGIYFEINSQVLDKIIEQINVKSIPKMIFLHFAKLVINIFVHNLKSIKIIIKIIKFLKKKNMNQKMKNLI